jgi:hypothetical protein
MDNHFSLDQLNQFTGSEYFFEHWGNRKMVYTEGVKYLAEKARCFWLIDEIALVIFPRLLLEYKDWFYSIELRAYAENSAFINISDGNDNIHFKHKINWTDFPVLEKPVQLYLCESGDNYCLMLSNEY